MNNEPVSRWHTKLRARGERRAQRLARDVRIADLYRAGLTQREIAGEIGMSQESVSAVLIRDGLSRGRRTAETATPALLRYWNRNHSARLADEIEESTNA